LAAKLRILDQYGERLPDREALCQQVRRYAVEEARRRAAHELRDDRREAVTAYFEFAAEIEEALPKLRRPSELESLREELEVQRGMVAVLRGSWSWRLSAPLRWLGGLVKQRP
jgi:hypothetical protein